MSRRVAVPSDKPKSSKRSHVSEAEESDSENEEKVGEEALVAKRQKTNSSSPESEAKEEEGGDDHDNHGTNNVNESSNVVQGVVDYKATVSGSIVSEDNEPCDCMMVQVNTSCGLDRFSILQLIKLNPEEDNDEDDSDMDEDEEDDYDSYAVFMRWGCTGSPGQTKTAVFFGHIEAKTFFQDKFQELTGLSWIQRNDTPIRGKFQFIQQNLDEKKVDYNGAVWQYWDNGWKDYDTSAGRCAEQLYHEYSVNHNNNGNQTYHAQLTTRLMKSGYWTYMIDFAQMTQTNIEHPNRTSRNIRRCPRRTVTNANSISIGVALGGRQTSSISSSSSSSSSSTSASSRTKPEALIYNAPDNMVDIAMSKIIPVCPPTNGETYNDDECVICLSEMKADEKVVSFDITGCSHMFHEECIKNVIRKSKPSCPICRKPIDEIQGCSPSGTMTISTSSRKCSGYESSSSGTIVIRYDMPSGIQKEYHQNPGNHYNGDYREAYLPDNEEGKALLIRLKYAWLKGLTFLIGTSMTTGVENSITWSSIHHKTSMNAGAMYHGFPDDSYFRNCNFELDALGIPTANQI